MAAAFNTIPDWFSWENQGGNAATADLDGNGRADLLIFMIDHPAPGPNRGLYRVAKNLDAAGNPAGGWGPWIDVPNWFSFQNQGCAIAVSDLNGNGRPDLIVFVIDHPTPGPNRGIYQIGRDLDAAGNVTGGWSGWIDVANWFSSQNQGCAIAVTDQIAPGRKDLIVLTVDHRVPGPNRGIYQIGKNLGADGRPTGGWGGWIDVDWFSWENQAAGLAIADLDGNHRPEIIVFQIDNPQGENAGQYRIGWNLDAAGRVQDGWGRWNNIDGWNSWEDQGGGIALVDVGATPRPRLFVFHIDNPPGQNQGLYRLLPIEVDLDEAPQKGLWRLLPYFSQVLPVHAALLHTGKVLFFAGSGNSFVRSDDPRFGDENARIYTSVVWDPTKADTFDHPPTLRDGNGKVVDFFCGGHAVLPDGRLLVVGGTLVYDRHNIRGTFQGRRDALIFDAVTETWSKTQPMAHGRWYPTLIARGDGSVLAASGLDEKVNSGINPELEIFDPATKSWRVVANERLPLYPHLYLLENGSIFYAGGQMSGNLGIKPRILTLHNPGVDVKIVQGLQLPDSRNQSASVLLPPAQSQKVMLIGGGAENDDDPRLATNVVDIIDLDAATPRYANQATFNLHFPRMHVNAVLLPDRTVLATGGSGKRENPILATLDCEIFDTQTQRWRVGAEGMVPRMYHSIALLLPDGRVVAAGSNPDKGSQAAWLPPAPLEEMRIEIYSPPYLFRGKRPKISSIPTAIHYGQALTIRSPEASSIKWISLIRPGLTTHSFNCEQRVVDVPFQLQLPDTLAGTVPAERNIAPPGWYMVFLTDQNGVPSVASWVELS